MVFPIIGAETLDGGYDMITGKNLTKSAPAVHDHVAGSVK